jgi:hypothetical protein
VNFEKEVNYVHVYTLYKNIVPKIVNLIIQKCALQSTSLMLTTCSDVNNLLKRRNISVGKIKLCVDRDLNCG